MSSQVVDITSNRTQIVEITPEFSPTTSTSSQVVFKPTEVELKGTIEGDIVRVETIRIITNAGGKPSLVLLFFNGNPTSYSELGEAISFSAVDSLLYWGKSEVVNEDVYTINASVEFKEVSGVRIPVDSNGNIWCSGITDPITRRSGTFSTLLVNLGIVRERN